MVKVNSVVKQLMRFFEDHTVSGRTRKLNSHVRELISDKSDVWKKATYPR